MYGKIDLAEDVKEQPVNINNITAKAIMNPLKTKLKSRIAVIINMQRRTKEIEINGQAISITFLDSYTF